MKKKDFLAGALAATVLFSGGTLPCVKGFAEEVGKIEKSVFMAAAYDSKGADQTNPMFSAALAADGDENTAWSVFSEAESGYIVIDLGAEQSINTVRLKEKGTQITDYTYEYSSDASNWVEWGIGGFVEIGDRTDQFPAVRARFVKLDINGCKDGGFSIAEIEIYRDPSVNILYDSTVKRIYKDVLPIGAEGKAISLLTGLGFVNGDEKGCFRPNEQITRGEFARIVANIYSEDRRIYAEAPFNDVEGDKWLTEAVSVVYGNGLMLGDGNGKFRPNDSITGAEAVTTMVSLAGYDLIAEADGGWFDGYYRMAVRLDLLKNLQVDLSKPITRKSIAILVANTLKADALDVGGISGGSMVYSESGETVLEKCAHISRKYGIVTGTSITGIDHAPASKKGTVEITSEGKTDFYFEGESGVIELLGHQVEVYYFVDSGAEDKTVRYVTDYNTEIKKINPEEIQSLKNGVLTYYDKNDKKRDVSISPTAPVIKNGVYANRLAHTLDSAADLSFISGELELIDNNGDGTSDVVVIRSYTNGLVESFSSVSEKILLKDTTGIPFDPDNERNRIWKNGREISPEELNAFDVVSILVSDDGDATTVYVSPYTAAKGIISEKEEDVVYIDGVKYRLCERINMNNRIYTPTEFLNALKMDSEVMIYLNIEQKIAGVFGIGTSFEYGYLLAVRSDTSFGEDKPILKIYNQKGKVVVYECSEKIRINGTRYSEDDAYKMLKTNVGTQQCVVRFKTTGEGKISQLNLPDVSAGAQGTPYTGDDDLIPYGEPYDFGSQRFYWGGKALANISNGLKEFVIDDSTVIFRVPENGDERYFSILSRGYFSNSEYYSVMPYNVDSVGKADFVAVKLPTSGDVDIYSKAYMVTDVDYVWDDETVKTRLTLVSNGAETQIVCEDDVVVTKFGIGANGEVNKDDITYLSLSSVQPGMIIQYADGNPVRGIQLYYPLADELGGPTTGWRRAYGWSDEKVFGKVKSVSGSNIVIDTGAMTCFYSLDTKMKIHIWNKDCEGTAATIADIQSADNVGDENADWVFYMPLTKSMFAFNYGE